MIQLYALIDDVRAVSRRLVRELGFLRSSLAGTGLPPSAVHALIEIDGSPGITAASLAERLRLEKSSISRLLRKLIESGDILESPDPTDGRSKSLWLTGPGQQRVSGIHAFARAQVAAALEQLQPAQRQTVLDGLTLYTAALGREAPSDLPVIAQGYLAGLLGRIAELHGRYYAAHAGFGQPFEAQVAAGLAEFSARLDHGNNGLWRAEWNGRVVGSVALDGQDLGEGIAHLRWFIVEDGLRGKGIGRHLLRAALDFADSRGFAETRLWTFRGLDAARHLYESHGFRLEEEWLGRQWGSEVMEQRFVRPRP